VISQKPPVRATASRGQPDRSRRQRFEGKNRMGNDDETTLDSLSHFPTKAEKIRTLGRAGHLRTDIARLLGVRYQHVRRVLLDAGINGGTKREVVLERDPFVDELVVDDSAPARRGDQELLDAGFHNVGEWRLLADGEFELSAPAPNEPGVYVFVVNGGVHYVGLTLTTLHRRLGQYRRGHVRQRTSARVKALIKAALVIGQRVEVLVATPDAQTWNGLPVNTAAGLEAGLIRRILPVWNMHGTSSGLE
jgi:hypothetical protein